LPTADGGVCVIDWENSGPADPAQELGCVLFEFARADPGRVRALTEAYQAAGEPATVNRRGHFSMLIAQLGHITETAATDWINANPARRSSPTPPRGSARFSTNRTLVSYWKPSWQRRAGPWHHQRPGI
jgi:aminoglycoside phosphotransferase (APT) family kinase protein